MNDQRRDTRNYQKKQAAPPAVLTNVTAERMVIGKVLQNESFYWEISEIVHPFHFSVKILESIYSAIQSIILEGKRISLTMIQSRVGPEYHDGKDDGASTMSLMTALMRDCENIEDINKEIHLLIEMWQRRRMIEICQFGLKEANRSDVDTGYLLFDMENSVKDISANSQSEPLLTMGQIARTVMINSGKARESGVSQGFDTGLADLDNILGKIYPGDLGVIIARQGDAKTVLGVQLLNRAQERLPACLFELEMKKEQIAMRIMAGESNVAVTDIEEGSYDMYEMEELNAVTEMLQKSKFYVDDRAKLRVDQIRDRCTALKRSKGLGLVCIDHLRLVQAHGRFSDKWARGEYITGELKSMAKDLDIAVIMLSQMTRGAQRKDNPAPQLNDFDAGASVEQDVDWALGMFRRDRYLKTNKPLDMATKEGSDWSAEMARCKDKIEIQCLKRRRGIDGEMRIFDFNGKRGLISDVER